MQGVFMKSIIRLAGIICAVLLLSSFAGAEDGQWELIRSKNGITTYRMTHPETDVCTFKAVGFVDAKIEVVGEVLRDISAYPEWMAKFKETTILKTIDRNTYIFHAVINTPFPYLDRDMVIENNTVYNLNNASVLLSFNLTRNYNFPEQKGYVRLTELEGEYHLEYFGRDKTRVTYQYRSDPGGNIPVSMANAIEIKYYPAMTITGLRRMVTKKKYINGGMVSPEYSMIERMLDNKKDVANIFKHRIGEYIIDPTLLNMMFETTISKKIVDNAYTAHCDYASIRQGMIDLLNVVDDTSLTGKAKQEIDALTAYITNKEYDDFFSMKKFMDDRWIVDEIAKDNKLIHGFFNMKSKFSKVLFEKATTSRTAVTSFIKDKKLAESILTNASLRKKLWEDSVLRERLANELSTFKNAGDFEKLIAQRVKSYSL
jgi:hypothetical protein